MQAVQKKEEQTKELNLKHPDKVEKILETCLVDWSLDSNCRIFSCSPPIQKGSNKRIRTPV